VRQVGYLLEIRQHFNICLQCCGGECRSLISSGPTESST